MFYGNGEIVFIFEQRRGIGRTLTPPGLRLISKREKWYACRDSNPKPPGP